MEKAQRVSYGEFIAYIANNATSIANVEHAGDGEWETGQRKGMLDAVAAYKRIPADRLSELFDKATRQKDEADARRRLGEISEVELQRAHAYRDEIENALHLVSMYLSRRGEPLSGSRSLGLGASIACECVLDAILKARQSGLDDGEVTKR